MSYPEMISVDSSTIESIGYDDNSQIVYVRFINGGLYSYHDVPFDEYENLLNASSCGSYLHNYYKGTYSYEKIE